MKLQINQKVITKTSIPTVGVIINIIGKRAQVLLGKDKSPFWFKLSSLEVIK